MAWVAVLLDWYDQNARRLPWRSVVTPYRTWISEVMLQQTQVETVLPYFERWMTQFPDLETLAAADEQDVLSLWEGLGYYSRARHLHRAARKIVAELGGELPSARAELEKLPGIGSYTSAAIASIAFGADVAAVDGNIRRVFSRLFNLTEPIRSTSSEKEICALAEANLPAGRAGDYNQALMDLGATVCTPSAPNCGQCPLREACQALALGVQEGRPVRAPRKRAPHLTVTAAVIRRNGRVLLAQRPTGGLLGGLWEFPGGTLESVDSDLPACLRREIQEELGVSVNVGQPFGEYRHAYTHFKITLHAFLCELAVEAEPRALESDQIVWVGLDQLDDFPMGKVDRQIATRLGKEFGNGGF